MGVTGTIFDVKRFAVHDGPGIRTTVFFKGCPLRCRWCHNPESQRLRPEPMAGANRRYCSLLSNGDPNVVGRVVTVEAVMREVEKDVVFYDESGGGVTFSGGEPLQQPHFLRALLEASRERVIHTAVDTSGFVPWPHLESICERVDLFLYDLKLMDDEAHRHYVGVSNDLIKENLRRLHDRGASIILRIPLIPGITDTEANLAQLTPFIAGLPGIRAVHLLPYNPIGEEKYERLDKPNPLDRLQTQPDEVLAAIRDSVASLPTEVKIGG